MSAVKADFCGIATPPQFHAPATIAALEAGMPVISEKPIADTLDAAKDMVRTAQQTALPCAIIQNYRYARNKQELVRIRNEGRLGRLQHIVVAMPATTENLAHGAKTGGTRWNLASSLKARCITSTCSAFSRAAIPTP